MFILHAQKRRCQGRFRHHGAAPGNQQIPRGGAQAVVGLQQQHAQACQIRQRRSRGGRLSWPTRLRLHPTRLCNRQRHRKAGPAAQCRAQRQGRTQNVSGARHDIQPQSHALGHIRTLAIDPVKLLENAPVVGRIDAASAVQHINANAGPVVHFAANNQHGTLAGVAQGVVAQVHHHPLQ